MRYLWSPSRDKRRVMHIAAFDETGRMTWFSLCGRGRFYRSINVPFRLGRRMCKDCERRLEVQGLHVVQRTVGGPR